MKNKLILAVVSLAIVAVTIGLVRSISASSYETYRAQGGQNGFWAWFAKDVCGVSHSDAGDKGEPRLAGKQQKPAEHQAKLDTRAMEAAKSDRQETLVSEAKAKSDAGVAQQKKRRSIRDILNMRKRLDRSAKTHGKSISTKGGETVVAGGAKGAAGEGGAEEEKYPYRVKAIRGIEFGSTDYAPGEDVKPLLSVFPDGTGNEYFEKMNWCEFKNLEESIYGFDQAVFRHTLETEELASLTFFKCFPPTEEGMAQAVALYNSMSEEASQELGFKLVEQDLSSESQNPTIVGFKSDEGDTQIIGGVQARGDRSIQVTLTVTDKPYKQELISQGDAVYDAGLVETVDAFVEKHPVRDYSKSKDRACGFLKNL